MKEKIIISHEKIDPAQAYEFLQGNNGAVGAMVVFSGVMRTHNEQGEIKNIMMEHYDKMTEASLAAIVARAQGQFSLEKIIVLHRVGDILPRDTIVVVGVAAKHRHDAFHAAEMVMDYLKTEAPFWKKEIMTDGNSNSNSNNWVAQKPTDSQAAKKWE